MPMSEEFELTERYTLASADEIVDTFTVVDPKPTAARSPASAR